MRLIAVHAKYQVTGGEDVSHASEVGLLRAAGNVVFDLNRDNADLARARTWTQLRETTYSRSGAAAMTTLIEEFEPDLVYANNLFPAWSPSVLRAARTAGVPVVRVLRNYRFSCIAGTQFREGHDCTECVGSRVGLPGIIHKCFRDSRAASSAVTAARLLQNAAGLNDLADLYICVSNYVADAARAGGLPSSKLRVRHNLVWPETSVVPAPDSECPDSHTLTFFGRSTPEKGLQTLLKAVAGDPSLRVNVVGDDSPTGQSNVQYWGRVNSHAVADIIRKTWRVVVPSTWAEPFGRVVAEALEVGCPVIVADSGGLREFAGPGVQLFKAGDADDLRRVIEGQRRLTVAQERAERSAARERYLNDFSSTSWLSKTAQIFGELGGRLEVGQP